VKRVRGEERRGKQTKRERLARRKADEIRVRFSRE
jgi:hypothetical protein